ncbi:hypothetical protein ACOMHN_004888 [Nucella lapillus]
MTTTSVHPIFLKTRDIPDSMNKRPTVLEMCLAAERSAGKGAVIGAQQINGADREEARSEGETEEMESSQPDDSHRQPLPQQNQQRRGRHEERQVTLSSPLRLQNPPRHRSETPKRPRSSEEYSPREVTGRGKYTKRNNGRSGRQEAPMTNTVGDTCR